MAKQPFTQETLYKLYEDNGVITLDLIAEALPTWTLADIKQRLSGWRYRKAIDYKLEDDELIDFEFLRNKKALTEATLLQGRLIIYVLPPYFMIFSQISTQKVRTKIY